MGDFNVSSSTAGQARLYSGEELDGPNACFGTSAASTSAPTAATSPPTAKASADSEEVIERATVGSLTPRPGETYEQCVNRYRNEMTQNYKVGGLFAGCVPGAIGGAVAGGSFAGPPGAFIGAGFGCMAGGMTGAMAAGGSGATSGEAEGKVACDGLPGSPEAAKKPPSPPPNTPAGPPKSSGAAP